MMKSVITGKDIFKAMSSLAPETKHIYKIKNYSKINTLRNKSQICMPFLFDY